MKVIKETIVVTIVGTSVDRHPGTEVRDGKVDYFSREPRRVRAVVGHNEVITSRI